VIINLMTAKALGLIIPQSPNEVIE
jgi:hypothetical protein